MQWSELIPALMGGKIDLIMSGMTDTPARRVQIDFCNPYMQTRIVTIMRARDKAKYNSIKAITETMANVGVVSGSTAEAMVRRRFPHARVMGYTSVENGVFDLKTMRIDLFVGEGPACLWAVSVNEGVLAGFWEPLQEEPLAWGVSRTNPEMKATANAVLTTWKQNGTLRRVLERWMPYIDKIQPPQPASPK